MSACTQGKCKTITQVETMKKSLYGNRWLQITTLLLLLLLNACGGGGGGGSNTPSVFTISGSIIPSSGSHIDSDVNDPRYRYIRNDSIITAQQIPNPVTLGGFVGVGGSGLTDSRSIVSEDKEDFFKVRLLAGQAMGLKLANLNSNLDLILYDANEVEVIRSDLGISQNESIIVPGNFSGERDFFIEVRAVAGAGNYTLTVGLSAPTVAAAELNQDFVVGEVIVRFNDDVLPENVVADSKEIRASSIGMKAIAGGAGRSMLMSLGDSKQRALAYQKLNIKKSSKVISETLQRKIETIQAMHALSRRSDVKSARLNYIYKPLAIPDDPNYVAQWHYPLINLPQAWDISKGSPNVIVAVIDTGILPMHPDLINKIVPGFDFILDAAASADGQSDGIKGDIDSDPTDPGDGEPNADSSFHGTHVAGTIAAETNNGVGVAGVGWNVNVMPLRVIGPGGGTSYDVEQAILFAARLPNDSGTLPARKADVINLSLGGPVGEDATPDAYLRARDAGVIIVAAAGNENSAAPTYPASYDDAVISVSAVDPNKDKAFYSNFGCYVDVAAPGGDESQNTNGDNIADGVMSTQGSDVSTLTYTYGIKQGTSMATPHIAGVAALMKSVYSNLTPAEFNRALRSGILTQDLGATGRDDVFGHGMIDAHAAVLTAQQLEAGSTIQASAFLSSSTCSLNFGTSGNTAKLTLSNVGDSVIPLSMVSVTNDSQNAWLSYTSPVNASGLGEYTFTVDRTQVSSNNTYQATITIVSSANTIKIPVIMQVTGVSTEDDAGLHYITLVDANTQQGVEQQAVNVVAGTYSFNFDSIDPGEYQIVAGTDMDNDGIICNEGEACGIYPLSAQGGSSFSLNGNLTNIEFITSFNSKLTSNAVLEETSKKALP